MSFTPTTPTPGAFGATPSVPTGTTSFGRLSSDSRTLSLNEFHRDQVSPTALLAWTRSAAVVETWRVRAEIGRPAILEDLWALLQEETTWSAWFGLTGPLDDYDADELELPAADRVLLAQYEPRRPDVDNDTGELQRVAVFFDTPSASWKVWHWTIPRGDASPDALARLEFREDTPGRVVLDDAGPATHRLTDDGTGRLILDDAAPSGLVLRATTTRILAY